MTTRRPTGRLLVLLTPLFLLGAGMLIAQTPAPLPQAPSFEADEVSWLEQTAAQVFDLRVRRLGANRDVEP